jgi:hypothetical protein
LGLWTECRDRGADRVAGLSAAPAGELTEADRETLGLVSANHRARLAVALEGRNRFRAESRLQSAELARRHSLYSWEAKELGEWIRDRLAVAPAVSTATEASEASGVRTSPAAAAGRAPAAEPFEANEVTRRHFYTPSELHARA